MIISKKILIAEDDKIIALDIKKYLTSLGYSVYDVVHEGETLLKRARKDLPALIISDISLQGELDGIEAISRLSEDYKIPYIFITGYSDYKRVVEIYHLKPVAFF